MKTMKPILRFSLILYLCLFLTGAAYILTASAKITPNPDMDGTTLITIVKGDTLWHLAIKHLDSARSWPEFKKYNTFSNPDRIYPGEMMRIPAEEVEEMIEVMVEEEMVTLKELEAVQAELAAMEARAMAAEAASADLAAIKMKVEGLIEQQKAVESGLKGVKDKVASTRDIVKKINKSLMGHAEASKNKLSKVKEEVKGAREDIANLRKTVKEKHKAGMEAMKVSDEMLAAGIKANGENIDKLHAMHAGATEEPNKSKRTLAFLTTLAGTAAWFAISSIDLD